MWRLVYVRDWVFGMIDRLVHEWIERNARKVNEGHDRWA